jgi:hypothetical protein
LWASENYKEAIKEIYLYKETRKNQLSKFIQYSNCWNIRFSVVLLVITLCIPKNGGMFIDIFLAFVMWRYISRSFEIAIAFVRDVLSSDSKSSLDNHARMKLAITSYFEIFIYSAAFYSAYSCSVLETHEPILTSLFVGTLTNVSDAIQSLICGCSLDLWYVFLLKCSVYLQVFATLSLIFFGFAGYLGRVKSNTKKKSS